MSIEVMSWVLNNSQVRGTEKLILIGLANHADADGHNAYPSVARLARYANVSERAVQQSLRNLEEGGHIYRHFNEGGSAQQRADRRPNKYTVRMRGVQSSSPRTDDGVQSSAQRGEVQRTNGVQPTSPETSLEPSIEPSLKNVLSPDAQRLANLLADKIAENGYKRPTVTQEWVRCMDRTIRIDGREPEQLEKAIEWVTGHDFWSMNVRSPQKLREHYDRLRAEASRTQKKSEPRGFAGIREYLEEQGV
jgi:hypothetical protein